MVGAARPCSFPSVSTAVVAGGAAAPGEVVADADGEAVVALIVALELAAVELVVELEVALVVALEVALAVALVVAAVAATTRSSSSYRSHSPSSSSDIPGPGSVERRCTLLSTSTPSPSLAAAARKLLVAVDKPSSVVVAAARKLLVAVDRTSVAVVVVVAAPVAVGVLVVDAARTRAG